MKNSISSGKFVTVTAPEALDSGEFTLVGDIGGVAVTSYESGDTEAVLDTEGVFELPKETSLAITAGDRLYWDTVTKKVDKTATNARLVGIAVADAASADTTVYAFISKELCASREGPQADAIADISSSDLVGVDGTGSNAAPLAGTETRLDALETKMNAILAAARANGWLAT